MSRALHPRVRKRILVLAAQGVPPADIVRAVAPLAMRLRANPPSYAHTRRLVREHALIAKIRREERDRLIANVLAGRPPIVR
ncbi:MAG: hypothetical protein WD689_05410 [Gaiellaceae bacterium]